MSAEGAVGYRYRRADFRPLPVRLEHMDIALDFRPDGKVDGTNRLRMTAREPLAEVVLNARELELRGLRFEGPDAAAVEPEHVLADALLRVRLPRPVGAGATFTIEARATCTPSASILEGIYLDSTPPGCPPQYVSQCQQWGFQRILPVIDDCTAKCTMRTRIEADARYTHLVSNGNICRRAHPDGRPSPVPGRPGRQAIAYENPVPMAPYLFVVCVGTWDVLEDEVVYPSGRRVKLEYLVPPGRRDGAAVPMQILKDAVLWQGRTQGYEYRHEVYRTICMEKSNFGGMENVGNTTIITEAALIDGYTGDRRLAYAHGVIVHEFEHNQCGSDVTMETPFDMWLNEAYTVDVERQFMRSRFDPDAVRLDEVDQMRAPLGGPLAIEDAGHHGNIVREGFNDPDELVDGVTYVKAAEVIRMLRLLLGEETFNRGRDLYFRRHGGGNANTDQFFACFREVSGRDLAQFRREWLHTIGYPAVTGEWAYDGDARRLRITLRQARRGGGGPFHVPVVLAAVDAAGRDIEGTSRVAELREPVTVLDLPAPAAPAFVSFNRDASFYGTFADAAATRGQLALQVRRDPNAFNRVEAMRRLTDLERIRLIEDPRAAVSDAWLELYGELLGDRATAAGLRAFLLRIDEQSLDRRYLPCFRERFRARRDLLRAVARRWYAAIEDAFGAVDTYARAAHPRDGLDERRLKGVLLESLAAADTPASHAAAEAHYRRAWNITDRVHALTALYLSSHPRRLELLDEAYEAWHGQLNGYAQYLGIVGQGLDEGVFERLAREERRPGFRLDHPTFCRALFLPAAGNNGRLWTEEGLAWLTGAILRVAPVNEITAVRLVAAFQQVRSLADDLRPRVERALRELQAGLDPARTPSVAGRVSAYLA